MAADAGSRSAATAAMMILVRRHLPKYLPTCVLIMYWMCYYHYRHYQPLPHVSTYVEQLLYLVP